MTSRDEFIKVDLHIHTPASVCYIDHVLPEAKRKTTPWDIVVAALAAGLQGIAVADHNTVRGVEPLLSAGKEGGLAILPGIELSGRGGHALAFFPEEVSLPALKKMLSSLGFSPEEEGDGSAQSSLWLDEVFRVIADYGGLAVAAHIDRRPRGFIASEEALSDKMRIAYSSFLSAVEITNPLEKERWNQGLVSPYKKGFPCIQGSDAHAPEEVGRRYILLQGPRLTFPSLREAFNHFQERIRFP